MTRCSSWIDVRDVARAHILAGSAPGAKGRYLVYSESHMWKDICGILKELFPEYPVTTGVWCPILALRWPPSPHFPAAATTTTTTTNTQPHPPCLHLRTSAMLYTTQWWWSVAECGHDCLPCWRYSSCAVVAWLLCVCIAYLYRSSPPFPPLFLGPKRVARAVWHR